MIETATTTLTVAELDRRLRAADPAAILVPSRLLRRIIKHDLYHGHAAMPSTGTPSKAPLACLLS